MKPMSERKAKAEAKRIEAIALAKHGVPRKSGEFVEVIETMEREGYKWRMMAATAIMIYGPGGPGTRWSEKKKAEFVMTERETTYRILGYLEEIIEGYKLGFREAVAEWYKKYGHRKPRAKRVA